MNPEEHPTSNIQRRTSNGRTNPRSFRRSVFDVGRSMFSLGSGVQCAKYFGETSPHETRSSRRKKTHFSNAECGVRNAELIRGSRRLLRFITPMREERPWASHEPSLFGASRLPLIRPQSTSITSHPGPFARPPAAPPHASAKGNPTALPACSCAGSCS